MVVRSHHSLQMWHSIRLSSKSRSSAPGCSNSSRRNGETFYPCSMLRLRVSVVHCNQRCHVSNVLQTSRTNRSSRLGQILSTRAIGNNALSDVQFIFALWMRIHSCFCLSSATSEQMDVRSQDRPQGVQDLWSSW